MSHIVGEKGQVVIVKEIRARLGIERGWSTIQRMVDDHVEIYFVPPAHRRSLKGSLAQYRRATVPAGAAWDKARAKAWRAAAADRSRESPESSERDA